MIQEKYKVSEEEFNKKIENVISKIKEREFIATNRIKYKVTEEELRNDFEYEDISLRNDKFDQVFVNGEFIVFFEDKIIWVV